MLLGRRRVIGVNRSKEISHVFYQPAMFRGNTIVPPPVLQLDKVCMRMTGESTQIVQIATAEASLSAVFVGHVLDGGVQALARRDEISRLEIAVESSRLGVRSAVDPAEARQGWITSVDVDVCVVALRTIGPLHGKRAKASDRLIVPAMIAIWPGDCWTDEGEQNQCKLDHRHYRQMMHDYGNKTWVGM